MKAAEYDRYGPSAVLAVRDVPDPRPPCRGEVLVRVHAAGLNPKDVLLRAGRFRLLSGRRFPMSVGFDFAGEVLAVGPGVTTPAPGTRCFGFLGGLRGGAAAELLVARARGLAPIPSALTYTDAAAVPLAASTALQALRDLGKLAPGQRVLVNGASGGVGVFAVQIARLLGARVTATASAGNLAFLRELGAETALDYRAGDPLDGRAGSFDVVFDVFGNRSLAQARPALAARGTYLTTVPGLAILRDAALTVVGWPRARLVLVRPRAADLARIAGWIEDGRLRVVVDQVYPLAEVARAEDHVATKHTRGKVVLDLAPR